MSASRVAATSAPQVVLRGKDQVWAFVVVIAGLECQRPSGRPGRFILHIPFSQPLYAFNRKRELQNLGSPQGAQQVPPLRSPGFPVELGGVGALHAPFPYRKAHTLPCPVLRGRKSGYAPVGMTKGRVALSEKIG